MERADPSALLKSITNATRALGSAASGGTGPAEGSRSHAQPQARDAHEGAGAGSHGLVLHASPVQIISPEALQMLNQTLEKRAGQSDMS